MRSLTPKNSNWQGKDCLKLVWATDSHRFWHSLQGLRSHSLKTPSEFLDPPPKWTFEKCFLKNDPLRIFSGFHYENLKCSEYSKPTDLWLMSFWEQFKLDKSSEEEQYHYWLGFNVKWYNIIPQGYLSPYQMPIITSPLFRRL